MIVTHSVQIQAKPATVFAFLVDINNRMIYIPRLEKVTMLNELPIRKGSRYIELSTIGGQLIESTYKVIEYIENEKITSKTLKSLFPIEVDLVVAPSESGTKLSIHLEFQLTGIYRLASSIVKGKVEQQAIQILENVKTELEKQTKSPQ